MEEKLDSMPSISQAPLILPLSCIEPDFGLSQKELSILFLSNNSKNSKRSIKTFSRSTLQKKISYTLSPMKEQYHLESIDPQEENHLLHQAFLKLSNQEPKDPLNPGEELTSIKPWVSEKGTVKLDEAPRLNFFRLNLLGKRLF
jgi:hypothetical protein